MMEIEAHLSYTRAHDWIDIRSKTIVRIGVTDFVQDLLGVIVFMELPELGTQLQEGDSYGCLESIKTVSDLCSPVSGQVVAVNDLLRKNPEIVNESPYTNGWIMEVAVADTEQYREFLSATQYEQHVS